LHDHIPGKCSHSMALHEEGTIRMLRLMMETGDTDEATRKVGVVLIMHVI